jgi:PPM family protein phosphatase
MIEIGSAIDPGRKRIASKNQDSLCVIRPTLFNRRPPLLVVADGMGGYEGGAVASQLVVSSFADVYQRSGPTIPPLQVLQAGVAAALAAMKQQAERDQALSRMGSTVVATVIKERSIHLVNVGDSRAYLINPRQVHQLSYDQSLVGELLRQGIIGEEDVRTHPRRNVLNMSISVQRDQVSTYSSVFEYQPGDRLVLCSDGLWGPVTEPQIQAVVLEYRPQQAAERLVQLANTNQGPDNISVIVALLG